MADGTEKLLVMKAVARKFCDIDSNGKITPGIGKFIYPIRRGKVSDLIFKSLIQCKVILTVNFFPHVHLMELTC